ncbi:unnamed protein product, partial [marine sediment metagenome]
ERVTVSLPMPQFISMPLEVKSIATFLGISPIDILDAAHPIGVVALSGCSNIIVPVKSCNFLLNIEPNFHLMKDYCDRFHLTEVVVYCLDTMDKDNTAHIRHFAPAIGINEDPVSGVGSASLGCYLVQNRIVSIEEQLILFNALDIKFAADIFESLKENQMIEILNTVSGEKKKAILNEMSPDDRTDLFAILPDEETEKLIPLLDKDEQRRTRELLAYKENTAGGLMTTDYITVPEDVKIGYVFRELRIKARDIDFIQYIYVVDKMNRLQGTIPLKDLLTTNPQRKVSRIMD